MSKILIIGQAPGIRNQKVPYDTTLLYEMLSWVGVTKEQAQTMFEFEAMSAEFPGKVKSSHKTPTQEEMHLHWGNVLEPKVILADKVWLLGKVASKYFHSLPKTWSCNLEIIETFHPSRRNYSKIMKQKEAITTLLSEFLNSTNHQP